MKTSETQPADNSKPLKSLVETMRQGLAPLSVRRRGAAGELPGPPAGKLEILVALAGDPEEEIRQQAVRTLFAWPSSELCQALASAATPCDVLLFAARVLTPNREDALEALLQNPAMDTDVQNALIAGLAGEAAVNESAANNEATNSKSANEAAPERQTTLQKIGRMNPAQKIKCALLGSQEERFLLIRDPNKMVARAVLQSPKLSEAEAEAYASMKNISEEVLRLIATNRSFIKSYVLMRALVNNPRAPIDVTLPLLSRLNDRDMKGLAVNKNVPDALRTTAAKTVMARQSTRGPSFRRH